VRGGSCGVWCSVFGVWCLVFGVWGLGFGVWGLSFQVWDLGVTSVSEFYQLQQGAEGLGLGVMD